MGQSSKLPERAGAGWVLHRKQNGGFEYSESKIHLQPDWGYMPTP